MWSCECDEQTCDDSSCNEGCNSGCPGCGTGEYWQYDGGECNSDNGGASCQECDSCSSGRYRAPCSGDRCGKGQDYFWEGWYLVGKAGTEVCGPCTWCASCDDGTYGPCKRIGCGAGTGGTEEGTCADCPQCSTGQYASSSTSQCSCDTCPTCGPGTYRDKCGTEANARGDTGTCEVCPEGKYKSGRSNANSCTDTFERCEPGEYLVGYSASSSGTCTACPAGKFKTSESYPYDEQCATCGNVNAGEYLDGCGGSSAGTAKSCPSNEYQPQPGSYTACTPCAPCAEGQHRDGCGDADAGSCTPGECSDECVDTPLGTMGAAGNGICEDGAMATDGGVDARGWDCLYGTDCQDCGVRNYRPPPSSPPSVPPSPPPVPPPPPPPRDCAHLYLSHSEERYHVRYQEATPPGLCVSRVLSERCEDGSAVWAYANDSAAGPPPSPPADERYAFATCVPGCLAEDDGAWMRDGDTREKAFFTSATLAVHPCTANCHEADASVRAIARRTCAPKGGLTCAVHVGGALTVAASAQVWRVTIHEDGRRVPSVEHDAYALSIAAVERSFLAASPSASPPLGTPLVLTITNISVEGNCSVVLYERADFGGAARTLAGGTHTLQSDEARAVRLVPRTRMVPTWRVALDASLGAQNATRFAHATCTVRCCEPTIDEFLDEMHHVQEDALFDRGAVATNR